MRKEEYSDIEKIRELNAEAFESEEEADLVNSLRDSGIPRISLVAEEAGEIVGHILFTPVELAGDDSRLKLSGLAPMAVAPEHQRQGIGSALVEAGIAECRAQGYDVIVVLGHPGYYPKFDFIPSVKYGIKSEYDVPHDVFMVMELKEGVLTGKEGTIKYHKAFGGE